MAENQTAVIEQIMKNQNTILYPVTTQDAVYCKSTEETTPYITLTEKIKAMEIDINSKGTNEGFRSLQDKVGYTAQESNTGKSSGLVADIEAINTKVGYTAKENGTESPSGLVADIEAINTKVGYTAKENGTEESSGLVADIEAINTKVGQTVADIKAINTKVGYTAKESGTKESSGLVADIEAINTKVETILTEEGNLQQQISNLKGVVGHPASGNSEGSGEPAEGIFKNIEDLNTAFLHPVIAEDTGFPPTKPLKENQLYIAYDRTKNEEGVKV